MKYYLLPEQAPKDYYNIAADLTEPLLPPLHPQTKQPVGPQDLAPLFPMELIKQEVSAERFIEIPDEVRALYQLYRPSPLVRAKRLEQALKTKARIYFKYEGSSPSGSHKTNTAIAQAFYNYQEGIKKIVTETGAGQWGTGIFVSQQKNTSRTHTTRKRCNYTRIIRNCHKRSRRGCRARRKNTLCVR